MASVFLPAIFSICASLGIAKPDCTSGFAIYGGKQTDKSLWYNGSVSRPDIYGKPSEAQCRNSTPIETYDIFDGTKGTSYACLAPLEEGIIPLTQVDGWLGLQPSRRPPPQWEVRGVDST